MNLRTLNRQLSPSFLCHLWQMLLLFRKSNLPFLGDPITLKDIELGTPVLLFTFPLTCLCVPCRRHIDLGEEL